VDGNDAKMKILHILSDGPGELPDRIIKIQSEDNKVEVIDLCEEGISYDTVVEAIFSCDKVVSW
jgi:hypothetical protein